MIKLEQVKYLARELSIAAGRKTPWRDYLGMALDILEVLEPWPDTEEEEHKYVKKLIYRALVKKVYSEP